MIPEQPQMIDMDELARCWGANDWAECTKAIRQGWGWGKTLDGESVLIWRADPSAHITVASWRGVP